MTLNKDAQKLFYAPAIFPEFWYDSNAYFGSVKSIKDLQKMIRYQLDPHFGALSTKDEFFDKSMQHYDNETLSFGTRSEHKGKLSLRQFLIQHNIDIDEITH